jgi:hypothetical protein
VEPEPRRQLAAAAAAAVQAQPLHPWPPAPK